MVILYGATGLLLVVFAALYATDRARVANGFAFNLLLLCGGVTLALLAVQRESPALNFLLILLGLALVFVLMFGLYILIALLLLNARVVLKRERRTLGNCLTLLLAVALIVFLIASALVADLQPPRWVSALWGGVVAVAFVFFVKVFNFLSATLLCNLALPRKNKDYIIVLGSGLVAGKVPPLLAGRIDRALDFYRKQEKKCVPPRLIFSGGKGADEPVSEAAAMAEYAKGKGLPEAFILLEDKSTSTAQNLLNSRGIVERLSPHGAKCLYATSNYHLLRAGIYARRAGLRAEGIGSRTAAYYLPSALLREFVGLLAMQKKRNAAQAVLVFLLGAGMGLLPELISWLARFAVGLPGVVQ